MTDERILRIPLPVTLIRDMDGLIAAGVGGLDTRADLAREAIEAMVLELRYGLAEPDTQPRPHPTLEPSRVEGVADITFTSLEAPLELNRYVDPLPPATNPLHGLHNRDYPSLWAAAHLCRILQSGPMPYTSIVASLLDEAWVFGERLTALDDTIAGKPSALFPTNPNKKQSAENKFQVFAIGSPPYETDGQPQANGVLFSWKVLGLEKAPDGPLVGLTRIGQELLASMAGLTVAQPHPPEYARRFLTHLANHAPGDWEGLSLMMREVASGVRRQDLIESFADRWPERRQKAANNVSGYIARGREWGFVETGQVERRYVLTELGQQVLSEMEVPNG